MSGLRIKQYRENNNYSQEDLAGFLGVTRRTISRWEQNKSKPNADELSRIAKFIGVSEEELLSEDDTACSTNVLERISDSVDNLVSGQETINESIISNRDVYDKKQDELIKELQDQNTRLLTKLDEQAEIIRSYKKELDLNRSELRHKRIRTGMIAVTCLIILSLVIVTWIYLVNHGLSNNYYSGVPVVDTSNGLSEEDISPTGLSEGMITPPQIMYQGMIYEYGFMGKREALPDGFEEVGTILTVDDYNIPTQDFFAGGRELNLAPEQQVFASESDISRIAVLCDGGYYLFSQKQL